MRSDRTERRNEHGTGCIEVKQKEPQHTEENSTRGKGRKVERQTEGKASPGKGVTEVGVVRKVRERRRRAGG